jgi:hypothetical protein
MKQSSSRRVDLRLQLAATTAAVAIAVAAGGWSAWSGRSERASAPAALSQTKPVPALSIVVLPFENLSEEPDQEYLADGIADDLMRDLSRISGSFVIAHDDAAAMLADLRVERFGAMRANVRASPPPCPSASNSRRHRRRGSRQGGELQSSFRRAGLLQAFENAVGHLSNKGGAAAHPAH